MAAGLRPSTQGMHLGRLAQWRSRFLRYIDTRPNGDALRKCILKGPYTPTIVTTPAVPATEDSPAVPENKVESSRMWEAIKRLTTRRIKNAENLALLQTYFKKSVQTTNNNSELPHTQKLECGSTPRFRNKQSDWTVENQWAVECCWGRKTLVSVGSNLTGLADTDDKKLHDKSWKHISIHGKVQEVPNADSGTDAEPLEQVQYDTDDNVFANDIQHFDQSESISNTCVVETDDSNVTPDLPDMCDNDIQDDQNDVEWMMSVLHLA
ncbi:hypothetical protein Tco_0952873 [Tanacetum coccineum]|uniref:Uncharacterized protein n=1 Tax=Tanacetum coccineum TaxID=301880 RepID=A0ABQ5E142_9ASTR